MQLFAKPQYSTVPSQKRDIPQGLWTKCPISGEIVYNSALEKNAYVVPGSGYHFPMSAPARIAHLADEGSFTEHDASLTSADPLKFKAKATYVEKLKQNQKKTGLNDAVVSGTCTIGGQPTQIAVMDFRFLGASMGSVVGEKLTRAIERGLQQKTPVIIVCASGGARMYEGILSLMQMAKTSAALKRLEAAGLPYISVLTHPTMAGVMASFATLGDFIIAEPGALIGFAGARVIEETTREKLPKGFQTAEFLLERGLIDQIVHRHAMPQRLAYFLKQTMAGHPAAAPTKTAPKATKPAKKAAKKVAA